MRDINNYTEKYLEINDFEKYQVFYRRNNLLKTINKYDHSNILEIGCGMEPIGKYVDDFKNYTIVEPSKEFCENAKLMFKTNNKVNIIHNFFEKCTNVFRGGMCQ